MTAKRLIRGALYTQVDVHKLAHRRRVVQLLFTRRVGEVEPQLQKVDPQSSFARRMVLPYFSKPGQCVLLHRGAL